MKKKILLVFTLLILLAAVFLAWGLFGPATAFSGSKYYLYIKTGMTYDEVMSLIRKDTVLQSPAIFELVAKKMDYPANIKAGKYEIKSGENLIAILRMLRNGRQTPVNIVITKLRTKEDLASMIGKKLECDSLSFMQLLGNSDSMRSYGVDTNTAMTVIFPNTYTYFWNTTPSKVFRKFFNAYKAYWTPQRIEESHQHNLNPQTAYILASIVEEETTKKEDKGNVASVYMNRLSKGIKLSADPTVKFAMHNFELKRVYDKYLLTESPYNTYKYVGLPPGPICTPSEETLNAVLTAPKTNYLFFVAKPDFSGYSNFSENYTQHLQYARLYQKALDEQMKIGQQAKAAGK